MPLTLFRETEQNIDTALNCKINGLDDCFLLFDQISRRKHTSSSCNKTNRQVLASDSMCSMTHLMMMSEMMTTWMTTQCWGCLWLGWQQCYHFLQQYNSALWDDKVGDNNRQDNGNLVTFGSSCTRRGRDSMIKCPVFLSSIILPANCSLLNFCSKPQIHWGFLHELLYKGN